QPGKGNPQEIEILNRAFQAFNEATEQLQSSYDELQARVKILDLELARKNEELETNLKEKEEVKNYLHNILESLTTGVIVVDRSNNITTFNKTAGSITGVSPETCLRKPLGDVFTTDLFENLVQRVVKNDGQALSLDRELDTPHHGKIHARISASPVMDNREEQIGTVLIVQDITQLRRLEEEAQRNRRLRATGEMAAGIAHEIRNPLGSIELFSSLLKKDLAEDEEKRKLVEHISSSVRNMDRIISSLLLFAKSPQPSRQKCDLNQLIQELFNNSTEILVPANIRPVLDLGDEMIANGDGGLLKQVFINLIRNGIQAMPDGGELSLRTQKGVGLEKSADCADSYRQFITITVTDSGEGISEENLANVFNPFFTTKDQGTGLGLSISHNIIKAHQGTIDVESEEGRGTRFIMNIPCWDDEFDKE
ncbi:MAG: PAS domain-containing protein, partial [Nitrospinae bacterium]|nr:PAS domain-containing protein [Nitrospinota bacterium]